MVKWKSENLVIIFIALSVVNCDDNLRLPKAIKPLHYDIKLESALDENGTTNYGGEVKIELEVLEEVNDIVLHHRGLNIRNTTLKNSSVDWPIDNPVYDNVTEFLTIHSNTTFIVGDILTLMIEFDGNLQTGTAGFYRSQYFVKGENSPRYLAATQFEPTRARSAFPCFDEPEWRTTFTLSITHGSNYNAISNMDGTKVDHGNGTATTTFNKTPVTMPTYLLAFVISDLTPNTLFPGRQKIYTVSSLNNYVTTSLLYSIQFLSQLENFVNVTYKFPKLDSVAVPDHGSAMENYGLILYKEQYLIEERYSHPNEKYDIVGTITHELAHQFFGNLVTCKWWDQIWLNEGFATWAEFLLPELFTATSNMQFHHLFNIKKTQNAFRSDALQSTRPMTYTTSTNAEISARFDRIAYDKSGAVIRMFQYMVGDDKFKAALNRYLSDNEHESITSDELLKAFENEIVASGYNFTEAFRTWENNKGFPVIDVVYDNTVNAFRITQKRYVAGLEDEDPNDANLKWFIPLSFTTEVNSDFSDGYFNDFMLPNETEKVISTSSITGFGSNNWYIFNIQQHGYYRVNYDTENWNKLISVLNSPNYKKIHVLNRAQLVDDALTMAFDGYLSYDVAFKVAQYLIRETEYFPWYSASIAFDKLNIMLKGTPEHTKFKKFLEYLIQGIYEYHGLFHDINNQNDQVIITQFVRELAIDWSCKLGNKKCKDYAYEIFKQAKENSTILFPPQQISFYCDVLRNESRTDDFNYLYDKMHNSDFQSERLRIIDGLLCSSNKVDLLRFLSDMVEADGKFYRIHERRRVFNSIVARSEVGLEVLVNFIRNSHGDLKKVMGDSFIDDILVITSTRLTSPEDQILLVELINHLTTNSTYELQTKTIEEITKSFEQIAKWRKKSSIQDIGKFVDDYLMSKWRLPKTSEPSHYKIHLDARNVQTGTLPYEGNVTITAKIIEETDFIVLHTKNQVFKTLKVTNAATMAEIPILYHTFQTEVDQVSIFFDRILSVRTEIQIHVKYSTELLEEIDGFYQDFYIDGSGNKKYLATTQFQAVEARRAFPCYDEPALKAVFELSITHDANYHAVANMIDLSINDNVDGTKTTHFKPTPVMSSYLNAFIVSDFQALSNNGTGKTLQRVWTRPDEVQKAQYGLKNSEKLLETLEEFVNMTYDLEKLDSGAIPGKGGGMENWGLLLYREAALIYEDDISHTLENRGVRLIAHEIVHLFFGDLVTGEWWNYLWLNEGFATDLMYSFVDKIYPKWHFKEFFSRNIMIPYAFVTDGSDYTRSMSSELITTSDINNSFDDIAYDKAACVLRMIGYSLGELLWKASLHKYLSDNAYKSVNSQHLINAIVSTIGSGHPLYVDFERYFRTWENQAGVPLVTVTYDSESNSFKLTQERFFEKKKTNSNDKTSWFIPINYATELDTDFDNITVTDYMRDGEIVTNISAPASFNSSMWYIFNKQQIGYYRVNYDAANWDAITKFLHTEKFNEIHVVNRMHLIDNAFVLAHGGYLDYQVPYGIITYLVNDNNFFTWDLFNDNINLLYNVFGSKHETLNLFMYHMTKNFYSQYKLENATNIPTEDMPVRYGRELAYFIACNAGNQECLDDTRTLGRLDVNNIKIIPRGLEHPVLCNYFKQSTIENEWMTVYNRMNYLIQNVDYTLKTNYINALGCANNADILYEFLKKSLVTIATNYTQSDRRNVFNAVIASEKGVEAITKMLKDYGSSDAPVKAYGWTWQRILLNVAGSIHTRAEQEIFLEFLENFIHVDVTTDLVERAARESENKFEAQKEAHNVRQIELIQEIIDNFLTENTTPGASPPTTTTKDTTTSKEPNSARSYGLSAILLGSLMILIMKV